MCGETSATPHFSLLHSHGPTALGHALCGHHGRGTVRPHHCGRAPRCRCACRGQDCALLRLRLHSCRPVCFVPRVRDALAVGLARRGADGGLRCASGRSRVVVSCCFADSPWQGQLLWRHVGDGLGGHGPPAWARSACCLLFERAWPRGPSCGHVAFHAARLQLRHGGTVCALCGAEDSSCVG